MAKSDIEIARDLAKASGNNFHCRVTNFLTQQAWQTLVSPYYVDAATRKPRELDLIAERCWRYQHEFRQRYGEVVFRLFLECKYINKPTVFWFSARDNQRAADWLDENTPLSRRNIYSQEHHYLASSASVAKLFASSRDSRTENEPIFRAVNQSLNALVSMKHRPLFHTDVRDFQSEILVAIDLPVIVCSSFDQFYRVEMEDPQDPQCITENFLLEVDYAYTSPSGDQCTAYFLIDVVEFSQLDGYMQSLELDKQAVFKLIE